MEENKQGGSALFQDVKKYIDEQGSVKVQVQYLETTKEGRKRFISFKEIIYG